MTVRLHAAGLWAKAQLVNGSLWHLGGIFFQKYTRVPCWTPVGCRYHIMLPLAVRALEECKQPRTSQQGWEWNGLWPLQLLKRVCVMNGLSFSVFCLFAQQQVKLFHSFLANHVSILWPKSPIYTMPLIISNYAVLGHTIAFIWRFCNMKTWENVNTYIENLSTCWTDCKYVVSKFDSFYTHIYTVYKIAW